MAVPFACIDKIVGITNLDCSCDTSGRPSGYNTSLSGKFLTDELPTDVVRLDKDCGNGSFWEMAVRTRDLAITETYETIFTCFRSRANQVVGTFNGTLGELPVAGSQAMPNTANYAGLSLKPIGATDGEVVIRGVRLAFAAAGTVHIELWDNYGIAPLYEADITTLANQAVIHQLPTPLTIQLGGGGRLDQRIYAIYETSAAPAPLAASAECGCEGKRTNYGRWTALAGITGEYLTDRAKWSWGSPFSHGVMLDLELRCSAASLFCPAGLSPDFVNNTWMARFARACNLRWATMVLEHLIRSGEPSPVLLIKGDDYGAEHQKMATDWANLATELCRKMEGNTCWRCKPSASYGSTFG